MFPVFYFIPQEIATFEDLCFFLYKKFIQNITVARKKFLSLSQGNILKLKKVSNDFK